MTVLIQQTTVSIREINGVRIGDKVVEPGPVVEPGAQNVVKIVVEKVARAEVEVLDPPLEAEAPDLAERGPDLKVQDPRVADHDRDLETTGRAPGHTHHDRMTF